MAEVERSLAGSAAHRYGAVAAGMSVAADTGHAVQALERLAPEAGVRHVERARLDIAASEVRQFLAAQTAFDSDAAAAGADTRPPPPRMPRTKKQDAAAAAASKKDAPCSAQRDLTQIPAGSAPVGSAPVPAPAAPPSSGACASVPAAKAALPNEVAVAAQWAAAAKRAHSWSPDSGRDSDGDSGSEDDNRDGREHLAKRARVQRQPSARVPVAAPLAGVGLCAPALGAYAAANPLQHVLPPASQQPSASPHGTPRALVATTRRAGVFVDHQCDGACLLPVFTAESVQYSRIEFLLYIVFATAMPC